MSKTYSYPTSDKLVWTLVTAGIGIFLLVIGAGFPMFTPQERPAVATSWLDALGVVEHPTFFTPLSQVILVIFGVLALISALLIFRAASAIIKIDEEAITYQRGTKVKRLPWSEVVDVKRRRTVGVRAGATEVVTLATKTDPYKITLNSKIKGYAELLEAVKTYSKLQF